MVRHDVAKEFFDPGTIHKHAEDLGVDMVFGGSHRAVLAKRIVKAQSMGARCGRLRFLQGFREVAASTSVLAHATYGVHIAGVSARQVQQLNKIVGQCVLRGRYTRAMPEALRHVICVGTKCDTLTRLVVDS